MERDGAPDTDTQNSQIAAVDLFCGAGGLTHGMASEGINVVAGFDLDPACRYPYDTNNKAEFIEKSVADISADELRDLYPPGAIKVLAGCAPCQPFSAYTQGRDAKKHSKWGLLGNFATLIQELRPELVTMENVPRVKHHDVFAEFVKALEDLKYNVSSYVVYCPDYGIPQARRRLVMFASLRGKIKIEEPTHSSQNYISVRDAFQDLPPIPAGTSSILDPLHQAASLTALNMERMRAAKPGGSWTDWPLELVAKCHKDSTGATYKSVYGRMEWDKPAPTITTQCYGFGNGRFGHPEQDRAISLREAALLQTFPKSYRFAETGKPVYTKVLSRLIGNAVPVDLGRVVARSLIQHVRETSGY